LKKTQLAEEYQIYKPT